jgi:hypothetical protein
MYNVFQMTTLKNGGEMHKNIICGIIDPRI